MTASEATTRATAVLDAVRYQVPSARYDPSVLICLIHAFAAELLAAANGRECECCRGTGANMISTKSTREHDPCLCCDGTKVKTTVGGK